MATKGYRQMSAVERARFAGADARFLVQLVLGADGTAPGRIVPSRQVQALVAMWWECDQGCDGVDRWENVKEPQLPAARSAEAMTVDELKLQRDGQLYYGLPNKRRIMVARCIENDHEGEWIEYGKGVMRCLTCLTVFRPNRSGSQTEER
jgi:hypothetical protein